MRWAQQEIGTEDAAALPGLGRIAGLIRSVQTPEFAGVTFHEVLAKSALNKIPSTSPMPFNWTLNPYRGCSHGCVYCLAGSTLILMADGRSRPLADLGAGDRIVGTQVVGGRRTYVNTEILAHWATRTPASRVSTDDGTVLEAGNDHRFLGEYGWRYVSSGGGSRVSLKAGDRLFGLGSLHQPPVADRGYRSGYLTGIATGDATFEAFRRRMVFSHRAGIPVGDLVGVAAGGGIPAAPGPLAWPRHPDRSWRLGVLAGVFDASGSCADGALRIWNADLSVVRRICESMVAVGFGCLVEQPAAGEELWAVRLLGDSAEQLRFLQLCDPAITAKRDFSGVAVHRLVRVTSVEPLKGDRDLFDITTGTGDFIADGVVSHNCFARGTHSYLELDTGRDFDTQIVVKTNVGQVLRKELAAPKWRREQVAMGTNTDPYQRAEGRYRLMPGIIEALAAGGTPFSILSKGTVLARDLPLLSRVADTVPVGMGVSLALLDRELQATLEPGTPSPQARLQLIGKIVDAGLPVGVLIAPLLPYLTDSREQISALVSELVSVGVSGVTGIVLHLRPGAREWFFTWLNENRPDLVGAYEKLYFRSSNAAQSYRSMIADRVRSVKAEFGLRSSGEPRVRGVPGASDASFPAGSMPVGMTGIGAVEEPSLF